MDGFILFEKKKSNYIGRKAIEKKIFNFKFFKKFQKLSLIEISKKKNNKFFAAIISLVKHDSVIKRDDII